MMAFLCAYLVFVAAIAFSLGCTIWICKDQSLGLKLITSIPCFIATAGLAYIIVVYILPNLN